jgi:hypothetical protein
MKYTVFTSRCSMPRICGAPHALAVFLHRQLAVAQRVVEHLAGVIAVAVLGPGARRLPRRHDDDRKRRRENLMR